MTRTKNQTRRYSEEATQDNRPPKSPHDVVSSLGESNSDHNPPSRFWDELSKVWLTKRALKEIDRRNNARSRREFTESDVLSTDITRFARHGGPDLCQLRGYPPPNTVQAMESLASSNHWTRPRRPKDKPSKAGRSSAYDKNFTSHLIDNDIYPLGHDYGSDSKPEPFNSEIIHRTLSARRPSLSPSRFTSSDFNSFVVAHDRVISEDTVKSDLLPIVHGKANIPSERNLPFTNLDSITDTPIATPVPDLYDGARPRDIDRTIREDLCTTIIPSRHAGAPFAPNFFLEAKAPGGTAEVAIRQACHDGALGGRAMHILQNYGQDDSIYDQNAYTFSSTFQAGAATLHIFAHHVTAPKHQGGQPEYHMTRMGQFAMVGSREAFVQGAAALRNVRDLAKRYRDVLIRDANDRASQAVAAREAIRALPEKNPKRVDHTGRSVPQAISQVLQRDTTTATHHGRPEGEKIAIPSKRPRPHRSPSRPPELSTRGSPRSPSRRNLVETHGRQDKVCFRDPDGSEFETEREEWVEKTADGSQCFHWQDTESERAFRARDLPNAKRARRGSDPD